MKLALPGRGAAGKDDGSGPSGDAAVLGWCRSVVASVGGLENEAVACSDGALRSRTEELRCRLAGGQSPDVVLAEAFATVREAARRTLGQRHHDVQIMGGAVLHLGKIAEMRTGEGKTLTATLPAYMAALSGQGVHVMTANDYLASRDRDWMAPVFEFLGMTVGLLPTEQNPARADQLAAYEADVTYGPWEQFGYDFLRDNLALAPAECVQRGRPLAIVDEADLILIDGMRVPLQVSGPAGKQGVLHAEIARLVGHLRSGADYIADPQTRTAALTEGGSRRVESWAGIDNLFDERNLVLAHLLDNALKAREFFTLGQHYMVSGDEAVIIDDRSGRPLAGRRYGEGIHEAIEAKEGLPVRPARRVLASVTMREYLRGYDRLAGMTGTAISEAPVYHDLYGTEVVSIPTNAPTIRIDHPDVLHKTTDAKLAALAAEASWRQASGQPVLIGAMSIEQADAVSGLLTAGGASHELLAARTHEREAEVIAGAGRPGAVTIVVKMAGRGVDIVLGGPDGTDYEAVADSGGLCVLGAERSEPRIETHLRGRAGRQGDPGESKFFVSAQDAVVGSVLRLVPMSLLKDGAPFPRLSAAISKTQASWAARVAASLVQQVAFDDVIGQQQRLAYADRRTVLAGQGLQARIAQMLDEVVSAEVAQAIRAGETAEQLLARVKLLYPLLLQPADLVHVYGASAAKDRDLHVRQLVSADAKRALTRREAQVGSGVMRQLEQRVLLTVTDRAWQGHLVAVDDLLTGLTIRAAGGTVPLPAYQRQAAQLFADMTDAIRRDAITQIFYLELTRGQKKG